MNPAGWWRYTEENLIQFLRAQKASLCKLRLLIYRANNWMCDAKHTIWRINISFKRLGVYKSEDQYKNIPNGRNLRINIWFASIVTARFSLNFTNDLSIKRLTSLFKYLRTENPQYALCGTKSDIYLVTAILVKAPPQEENRECYPILPRSFKTLAGRTGARSQTIFKRNFCNEEKTQVFSYYCRKQLQQYSVMVVLAIAED